MKPFMAPEEWAQVQAAIYAVAPTTILEWGSGGSTLELHKLAKKLLSVEHDPAWFREVHEQLPVERRSSLMLVPASEPEVGVNWQWRQRAEYDRSLMEAYIDFPRAEGFRPDVILVDGRARRFCIVEGLELLRPGGLLVLHDAQRRYYHDFLPGHALFLDGWRQGQVCLVRKH